MTTAIEIPEHWMQFIFENSLEGIEVGFPWPDEEDLTCVMEVLSEADIIDEATNYWPGIGVYKDGFIPVGHCGIGTGDPYFINVNDGINGPLYKIDHERVSEKGYKKDEAISIMLRNYDELLKHIHT